MLFDYQYAFLKDDQGDRLNVYKIFTHYRRTLPHSYGEI